MMEDSVSEDETYKFFFKKLKVKFHRRICGDGEEIEIFNPELIPIGSEHKHMDTYYKVDDKYQQNMEFQSTPVYANRMFGIFIYMVLALAELLLEIHTCILATYPPTQGIRKLQIWQIIFTPMFFFTKDLKASEIIKTVKNKNINNIALTDNEAIDLLIAPDMDHNYEIKELLEITTILLVEAYIPDCEFHENLIACQRKVLKRFLNKNERKEIENMIDLKAKAKELGIEPNVTGFEEEMRIEYLDGKREGKIEGKREGKREAKIGVARKLLEDGFDEEVVSRYTDIPIEKIKRYL